MLTTLLTWTERIALLHAFFSASSHGKLRMARRKNRIDGQGSAQAKPLVKDHHATNTKSPDATSRLSDLDNTAKTHPARLPKVKATKLPEPMNDSHRSTKEQTTNIMPQIITGDSLSHSEGRLPNNKRLRDDDGQSVAHSPDKRAKLNGNPGLDHHSNTNSTEILSSTTGNSKSYPKVSSEAQRILPAEVQHLGENYEFSTMSIISSSKIESRVRNLLEKTGNFTFANTKAKPGVVILRANVKVASRMCSIVEIAKKIIKDEKGKWWQYTKLHGELLGLKPKQAKRAGGGRTLAEWGDEQNRNGGTETKAANETEDTSMERQEDEGIVDKDEDEDMEEDFEMMTNPKERDHGALTTGSGVEKKVRNTPVMTIFFSRVPIPGLKEIYG